MTAIAALFGVLIDYFIGEPRRWHPLVGFGHAAIWLEKKYNRSDSARGKWRGLACWSLLVIPPSCALYLLLQELSGLTIFLINCLTVYFVVGLNSLASHGRNVAKKLLLGDTVNARLQLSMMVSRDTNELTDQQIAAGTCESLLENGSDAVFAPIFWFILFGAPGAIFYRFSNTLDAMWGYRSDRYHQFGWAAARIDDLLNWLPARLTVFGYAVSGHFSKAISCSRQQGGLTESPNAGHVMASGAGALEITLGGPATYNGVEHQRPAFGIGPLATAIDIEKSIGLIQRCTVLSLQAILVIAFFL